MQFLGKLREVEEVFRGQVLNRFTEITGVILENSTTLEFLVNNYQDSESVDLLTGKGRVVSLSDSLETSEFVSTNGDDLTFNEFNSLEALKRFAEDSGITEIFLLKEDGWVSI